MKHLLQYLTSSARNQPELSRDNASDSELDNTLNNTMRETLLQHARGIEALVRYLQASANDRLSDGQQELLNEVTKKILKKMEDYWVLSLKASNGHQKLSEDWEFNIWIVESIISSLKYTREMKDLQASTSNPLSNGQREQSNKIIDKILTQLAENFHSLEESLRNYVIPAEDSSSNNELNGAKRENLMSSPQTSAGDPSSASNNKCGLTEDGAPSDLVGPGS